MSKEYKYDPEFERLLKKEGVDGEVADVARAIYVQESGSGKNTKTSNHNAIGGMQIKPKTFSVVADKGWSIHNPLHNMQAGIRYVKQLFDKSGGDQRLTAIGYYGGPGAIEADKKGITWRDRKNPSAPTIRQYGDQVMNTIKKFSGSSAHASEVKPTTKGVTPKVAPNVVAQARQILKDNPELSRAKPQAALPSAVRKQAPVVQAKPADPNGMLVNKKPATEENNLFGFKGPVKDPVFNTFSSYDNLSRYGKVKINEETSKPVVQPKTLAKTEAPVKKIYDAPGSITGEMVTPLNRAEGKNEIAARAKFKDSVLGLEKDKQAELRGEGKQVPRVIKETAIPKATVKDIPKSAPVEVAAPKLSTPAAKVVETKSDIPVNNTKQVNEFTEKLQPVSSTPVQTIPSKAVEPVTNDYGLDDEDIPEPAKVIKPANITPIEKGNINLNNRPIVNNKDGSISTIRSIGKNIDGVEVLLPTVVNGKVVSNDEAVAHYKKTGEHLGKFNSVAESNTYAQKLHEEQDKLYSKQTNPVDSIYTPDNQKFANKNSLLNGSAGNPGTIEQAVFPETTRTPEDYFKEAMGLKPVLGTEPLSTIQPETNPVDTDYFPGSEGFANRNSIFPGSLGRPQAIEQILNPNTFMPVQDDYSSLEKYANKPMFQNTVTPAASTTPVNNTGLDMTSEEFAANHQRLQDWAYKDNPQTVTDFPATYVPQVDTVSRPVINIPEDNIRGIEGSFKAPDIFQGSLNKPVSTEQGIFPNTTMPLEDNYQEVQGVAPALSQRRFTQTPNINSTGFNVNDDVLGGISVRAKRDPYQEFAEVHQRVTKPVQAADLNYLKAMTDLGKVQVPDFMSTIGKINQVPVQMNAMTPQSNDMRNLLMYQMRRS